LTNNKIFFIEKKNLMKKKDKKIKKYAEILRHRAGRIYRPYFPPLDICTLPARPSGDR
jgi:hypothetical protein